MAIRSAVTTCTGAAWPCRSSPAPRGRIRGASSFCGGNRTLRSSLPPNAAREHMIHYRILMEPIGTNVFFLAPWARRVTGDYRTVAADSVGAVYNFDIEHGISRYEAESDIAAPAPAELRTAGRTDPTQIPAVYLHLLAVDPRVPRLAAEITASAS